MSAVAAPENEIPHRWSSRRTVLTVTAIWIAVHLYFLGFKLLWPADGQPMLQRSLLADSFFASVVSVIATLSLIPVTRRLATSEGRRRYDLLLVWLSVPLFTAVLAAVQQLVLLFPSFDGRQLLSRTGLFVLTPFGAATGAMAAVVAYFVTLREEASERERRRFELGALLMRGQAERLRARVAPPFMAAVLDTISAEIDRDRDRADDMLVTFAALLRTVLDIEGESNIPLETELEIVDGLLGLTAGVTALTLLVDDDALVAELPPLVVYPVAALFVEERAPRITIASSVRDALEVTVTASSALTADELLSRLATLQQRLAYLHPGRETLRVDAADGVSYVRLSLPAIRSKELPDDHQSLDH